MSIVSPPLAISSSVHSSLPPSVGVRREMR